MKRICLSLGANLGDATETLRSVVTDMFVEDIIFDMQVSSIYETKPVGEIEQPNFYNLSIIAKTDLEPLALLEYVQGLEARYGRERTLRWGPRTLDIDIIDIDGEPFHHERLTLPHPEAPKRAFVLVGIAEISTKFEIGGTSVKEWITETGIEGIRKLEDEM